MDLFACTCPYREIAMIIQKMLQTFTTYQPVHYCCSDKPINTSFMSKNTSYRHKFTTIVGRKKSPTFKSRIFFC